MPPKKFLVVARNTNTSENGLMTSKGNIHFHRKTAKIISDPVLASEIDVRYGVKGTGDVWVERDQRFEHASAYHDGMDANKLNTSTHHFFFGSTRSFREGWEKVFGK
jgi:hypothetical protein